MNFKLQEAREKIELQVSQARLKVKEAARKMEVAEKNQVKADENLKYANLGFQEGTISSRYPMCWKPKRLGWLLMPI